MGKHRLTTEVKAMNNDELEILTNRILILRYGCKDAKRNDPIFFTLKQIGDYLEFDQKVVLSLIEKHFYKINSSRKFKLLTPFMINFLTNDNYLIKRGTWSLQQRVEEFKIKYSGIKMNRWKLRKLYNSIMMRKKKVMQKGDNPKKYPQDEKLKWKQRIQKELLRLDRFGKEIWQIDESIFSAQDYIGSAWSKKKQNIKIQKLSSHSARTCVISAITTKGRGHSHLKQKHYYDSSEVINFLEELKCLTGKDRMVVFWDNCSTHTSKETTDWLKKNNVEVVQNVPYEPEYNGIERMWAHAKQKYRKQITELKIKGEKFKNIEVVDEIMQSFKCEQLKMCASYGWKQLFQGNDLYQIQNFQV